MAELQPQAVSHLLSHLGDSYYASESAIREAIGQRSSFNLIHLATSFKLDVFVSKGRPFDIGAMHRAQQCRLVPGEEFIVRIASPEDVIVTKLEWCRLGDEASERQWADVVSVLEVLGDQADTDYLRSSAAQLGVADLLEKLLAGFNRN